MLARLSFLLKMSAYTKFCFFKLSNISLSIFFVDPFIPSISSKVFFNASESVKIFSFSFVPTNESLNRSKLLIIFSIPTFSSSTKPLLLSPTDPSALVNTETEAAAADALSTISVNAFAEIAETA